MFVKQISTKDPRGWGSMCRVKSEVDNEEPRAKTVDHGGKCSTEVKDEHLQYFCFAEMQRKDIRSLRLVPTQLPSVQNALWSLNAVSIFQTFPTFALKIIQEWFHTCFCWKEHFSAGPRENFVLYAQNCIFLAVFSLMESNQRLLRRFYGMNRALMLN